MDRKRALAVVWLGTCVGLMSAQAVAQAPKPTLKFIIPQRTLVPAAGQTPRTRQVVNPSYWWNEAAMIEALQLTEEQRKKMDAAMAGSDQKTTDLQHKQNADREKFDTALKAREWDAASKAAKDWEEALAQTWGVQNRSKIDVLKELTEEQQRKLLQEHEYLLARPWVGGRRIEFKGGPQTVGLGPTPTPAQ
jgi:hypothetical protein